MTIREGKWKCPNCSTVNRGAETQCHQCGTTRDANVKFFLDEDAPEVTDEEQLKKAQAGADWICEYCGNSSPAFSAICTACGAKKSTIEKKHGDVIPVGGPPPAKPTGELKATPPPTSTGNKWPLVVAVLALMFLCCCTCSWFTFRTQQETATVASVGWERKVVVEDFLPTEESAWESAPQGAYKVTHRREQRSTRQVQVGTHTVYEDERVQTGTRRVVTGHRDLGNGHFEDVTKDEPVYETKKVAKEVPTYRDEPVFAERYYYTIDKWRAVRTERAKGSTEPPTWPDVRLKGKEREGPKAELYLVTFKGEKVPEKVMKAKSAETWLEFKPGTTWKVQFNNAGDYKVLDANGTPRDLQPTDERIE